MAGIVSSMTAVVSANTAGFTSGMEKARASTSRFQRSTKNIERRLAKIGKQMTKVGKQMSIAVSAPLALLGGLAVKTFADFEQEMAKVQAVSGATGKTFDDLKKLAEDLGKSTRFTAGEVANLQLNYSKLGFVPSEIQKITASTLDLALATGEDLADSAEVAGATLRGFGLTAEEMPRVIDVMALSFSSSALELTKFKDSMKTVAPVATAVGATLEDTTATLGILTNAGLDASTAGTSLRNIFIRLKKQGITWDEAMKKIRGSSDKLTTSVELFGVKSATAGLIIAENEGEISKLTVSLENAEGSAKKMAKIMDATLKGSMLKVKSALEGLAISFGQVLAPTVKFIGEKIAILANKFEALSPTTKKFVLIAAGIAAAIGPALVALGFLATTILPALISGFAILTGPIGLVILAVAALTAGIIAFSRESKKARNIQELMNDVSKDAQKAITSEVIELRKLLRIAEDERLSKDDRLKAIKKLNEISPEYLGNLTLENIKTDDARIATEKYRDAILAKAKAQATSNKISKLTEELLEIELKETEEFISFFEKMAGGFATSKEQLAKFNEELENKAIERKATEVKRLGDEINRLITIEFAAETSTDNLTTSTDDLTKADKNLTDTISSGNKVKEKFIEGTLGAIKAQMASIEKEKDFASTRAETIKIDERLNELEEKRAKILGIETSAMKKSREEEEKRQKKEIEIIKFTPEEMEEFDVPFDSKKIKEEAEKIRGETLTIFQKLKENFDGIVNKIQEKFQDFAEISGQIWGQISDIIGQSIENKLIKLENSHAREVEMIENSRLSEEQKQAAILKLDKKTEKERKKLLRRQAILAKINAIFNATINAAAAVVRALATGGPILAAIVGALGAIQIGVIASQPIPLQEGGIITRPTTAIIGEAGPEAVIPLSKMGDMGFDKELTVKITAEDIDLILKRREKRLSFTS